jgi:hypothetical protein
MSETKESYLARMLGEAQGEREEGRCKNALAWDEYEHTAVRRE